MRVSLEAFFTPEQLDELAALVAERLQPGTRESEFEWLSLADVARILGRSENAVRILVTRKGCPAHKVGGRLRFRRDELNAWIERTSE